MQVNLKTPQNPKNLMQGAAWPPCCKRSVWLSLSSARAWARGGRLPGPGLLGTERAHLDQQAAAFVMHTCFMNTAVTQACKVTVQTWLLCSAGMLSVYMSGLWLFETLGEWVTGQVLRSVGRTSAIAQVLQWDIGRKQVLGDIVPRQNFIAQILWVVSQGCGSGAIARLFSDFGMHS